MAERLPRDANGIAMQLTPSSVALGQLVTSSISASTTRNLTAGTSLLRAYAVNQDVFLKWGATAVTSSNFDEVIPANQVVDLVVPRDSTGALFTTIRVIERAATATLILVEK